MSEIGTPSNAATQHPPLMPGVMPPRPSAWPMVLGIIAIVLGVFGVMQGAMGLITPLFFDEFRQLGNAAAGGATAAGGTRQGGATGGGLGFDPFAGIDQFRPLMIVTSIATIAAGAWLFVSGLLMTMRKRLAWLASITWSAFKIAVVLCSSMLSYHISQSQVAAMQQSGMSMPGMQGIMNVMGVLGTILGIAWGCALPIFMIVWFTRRKIRAEVSSW